MYGNSEPHANQLHKSLTVADRKSMADGNQALHLDDARGYGGASSPESWVSIYPTSNGVFLSTEDIERCEGCHRRSRMVDCHESDGGVSFDSTCYNNQRASQQTKSEHISESCWADLGRQLGGCTRDRSMSNCSTPSSQSAESDTWDRPNRSDTMDTQLHDVCETSCRSSHLATATCHPEGHDTTTNATMGHSEAQREDSDIGNDSLTSTENACGGWHFADSNSADAWLNATFDQRRVEEIKAYWRWSTLYNNWIHEDPNTGSIVECPEELD